MKKDVETLLRSNSDAIVIIIGDHGPYLTKNCSVIKNYSPSEINRYDIQDRYGSFLAIKWPNEFKSNYNISNLQEVFPSILAYLYDKEEIWKKGKTSSRTVGNAAGKGIYVEEGIIYGGKDNGQKLFLGK